LRPPFWKADWFAGLAISLAFALVAGTGWLQGLERTAYDLGVRAASATPSEQVTVVAIDDESIARLGRWPWPRDVHARLIDLLREGGAKVIGHTVFFLEPQRDPGLLYIEEIARFYAESALARQPAGDAAVLGKMLREARRELDTDRRLAESIRAAGNVVLGIPFVLGQPRGRPNQPLPDYVLANALTNVVDRTDAARRGLFPLPTVAATPPIPRVGESADALGNLLVKGDVDARSEALVTLHYDTYYPSFALQVAARSLDLGVDDIRVFLGEGVRVRGLSIATDTRLRLYNFFYGAQGGQAPFPVDSFYDVYTGRIPAEKYRDKVVLIGATAAGVGSAQVTPISGATPPVLTLAHAVSSILQEDFFVLPAWGGWAEAAIFAAVAAYLVGLLPRLRAGVAAALTTGLLAALVAGHLVLMTTQALWLQLMLPATLLLAGHLLLTSKRLLVAERGKLKSGAESAESNRMLGLAFQGRGQLDMAFEEFRKLPRNDSVMDLLYNLALDYERKRQFNKAGSVYQYIAEFDPGFRNVKQRVTRSKAMEDTALLGAGAGAGQGTLLLEGEGVGKPMLGRYQVEKELGKGAMGVVYLGRDPKIHRVVAIKTLALSQEFEEDELDEVKERFFREAETAGRLNHPHIVTIYDAGEEHDLAYIAMEFLQGKDLSVYTKPEALLPLPQVLDIVAKAADALDYAHAQNVVHRDIKPANIMFEAGSANIKLTDFGIARITDSSKTKTGMVLGTPSYMSPEQLAGSKVDGRSDLFSLGVMLYQLATGHLPFKGDSMATLMYRIANEAHPDPVTLRPELPPCLRAIIDRALHKSVEERYQRGGEMARDLRACAGRLAA